jgi:hypothetical protein
VVFGDADLSWWFGRLVLGHETVSSLL